MHLNKDSRSRLATYFYNIRDDVKKNTFQAFTDLVYSISKPNLKYNYREDVRTAIAEDDILFVTTLIMQIINEHQKTKTGKKIKYINNSILKSSSLRYEDGTIYKYGAFAEVSKVEIEGVYYARKTLLDSNKKELLRHEIAIMQDVSRLCSLTEIEPFSINVIQSTENSYDMILYHYDLEEFIELSTLTEEQKYDLIRQLLKIINYLIDFQIIHRDLHPGNFLLDNSKETPKMLVSDFGLSRYIYDGTDLHNYLDEQYGREDYISSKQRINLSNCDIKTELFSVGRLINYIMNKNPANFSHEFGRITRKTDILSYDDYWSFINDINGVLDR